MYDTTHSQCPARGRRVYYVRVVVREKRRPGPPLTVRGALEGVVDSADGGCIFLLLLVFNNIAVRYASAHTTVIDSTISLSPIIYLFVSVTAYNTIALFTRRRSFESRVSTNEIGFFHTIGRFCRRIDEKHEQTSIKK